MSVPDRGETPGDLIEEYLRQLRAGMRLGPAEAELILAEAEDHLRETAAAGLATGGMTGREAQEAAISSFGSVRAVTHAHRARLARVARPVDVAMAAWKLVSLLLLAGGVTGMASVMLAVLAASGFHWYFLGFLPPNSSFAFAVGGYVIGWPGPAGFSWPVWSVVAIAGALALTGYLLVRRRQRRRGTENSPPGPLGRFFPVVAASIFAVMALALAGLAVSDAGGALVGLAACLVLAAVYGVRTPRSRRRQQHGQEMAR
jgi:hypothetical protein